MNGLWLGQRTPAHGEAALQWPLPAKSSRLKGGVVAVLGFIETGSEDLVHGVDELVLVHVGERIIHPFLAVGWRSGQQPGGRPLPGEAELLGAINENVMTIGVDHPTDMLPAG